ncbi:hypothetical protein GO013_16160 [Pseudodesulfovibrio sp. JC047]|nr:hypothetical protein [Pseudodesulfovibrio sp. JC047]NDV20946.1 hypothetical protein [Pseudodesulfovibrio sp. JC047]
MEKCFFVHRATIGHFGPEGNKKSLLGKGKVLNWQLVVLHAMYETKWGVI